MHAFSFRGINLKMPAGAFREAVKRESPKRTREGQTPDPTGPITQASYGSEAYAAALGEQPILITPDGVARILPPGATPTEHPDTMGVIADWDRAGIIRRYVGRTNWTVALRPSTADAAEWDQVMLSLSRQAGEEATPEQVKTAYAILADVLRTPPLRFSRDGDPETYNRWLAEKRITRGDVLGLDGYRTVYLLPIHDNTDNIHVQVFVHRHPVDLEKHEVGAAIKQHEPIVSRGQVAALNALFEANGLPFFVENGFERINAGGGATLDTEQAAELVQTIEAAGGTAPARLTSGQQGQLAGVVATGGITPEAAKISESIDDDAKTLARLKSEIDALALRMAAKQHAVAAIQEAAAARAAQEVAEARAVQEAAARAAAEQVAADLQARLAMESEKLLRSEDKVSQLDRVIEQEPERTAKAVEAAIAPLQTRIDGEPERTVKAVADAIKPLQTRIDRLQQDFETEKTARQKADTALKVEQDTFLGRAKAWAETNVGAPLRQRAEKAEAALAKALADLAEWPAKAEAMVDAMEMRLQRTYDAAKKEAVDAAVAVKDGILEEKRLAYEAAMQAKDAIIAGLEGTIAALRGGRGGGSGSAPPAGPTSPPPPPASGTGTSAVKASGPAPAPRRGWQTPPGPGDDFYKKPSAEWTQIERSFATREFRARQDKNPKLANTTLAE